jgi:hypothetical protein
MAQLEEYFANPDSLWAIAQHYGLKTNFIDFSDDPRVAAFFACDMNAEPSKSQNAAIICVNSDDFTTFWKEVGTVLLKRVEATSHPHFIRIDVSNLWRLQQQKGSFLWNPVVDIEQAYDFDRIVFPYVKEDPSLPKRQDIYPINQSELEKLLTQFFMNEQLRAGKRVLGALSVAFLKIEAPVDSYDAKSWCPAGISVTSDWAETSAWDKREAARSDTALPGFPVELDPHASPKQISEILLSMLSPTFIELNRAKALDMRAKGGEVLAGNCARMASCVRRLWNGMRTLPYSATDIRTAIKKTLNLIPLAEQGISDQSAFGRAGLYVDMASNTDGYGAYSRGTVTREAFIEAHNQEFLVAVRANLEASDPSCRGKTDIDLAKAFLQRAGRPWERFAFSGLKRLMIEELIPTQIAWRVPQDEADLRVVIYFSPKEFRVFGLA